MAIYSFNRKIVKRTHADGRIRNAVFAAAYYRGEKRTCYQTEETKDFSVKHGDVIYKDCFLPDDSPEWATKLRNALVQNEEGKYGYDQTGLIFSEYVWNLIEQMEKRHDSQIYIRDIIALPIELNQEQAIALAKEFVQTVLAVDGIFCEVAVHWDLVNPHIHYMRPAFRRLTESGFSKKIRLTQGELRSQLLKHRELWAEFANQKLSMCGYDVRIDHRSYKERGIDLIPTVKVGKATHMHGTEHQELRIAENQRIRGENFQKVQANPNILIQKIAQEHQTITVQNIQDEVSRYVVNEQILEKIQTGQNVSNEKIVASIIDILKKKYTVFNERILKTEVLKHSEDSKSYQTIINRILTSSELFKLGLGEDGREHYVTREVFQLELGLIRTAEKLHRKSTFLVLPADVSKYSDLYTLNAGQKTALNYITQGRNIALVRGMAGTGKTYLLKPANIIWKRAGYRVHGVAFLGRAAAGLEHETGIRSKTIDQFLSGVRRGFVRLDHRDIIVMDEKGMTSLDHLNLLLKVVEAAGAKFVAVGDTEQTQPTGRGAAAKALMDTVGGVVLDDILRQEIDWQREATFLMETQHTDQGLNAYQEHGNTYTVGTPGEAIQLTVQQWFDQWQKDRDAFKNHMMTAYRNDTIRELNIVARERLIDCGTISDSKTFQMTSGALDIAVGERLLFTRNDYRLGVRNGDFGVVEKMKDDQLWVRLDHGILKQFSTQHYRDITYGYAATIHKLQGYTGNYVRLYIDSRGFDRHLFLVGATRHRQDLSIILDQEHFQNYNVLRDIVSRDGLKDHVFDFPAAFAIRRGFDQSRMIKKVVDLLSHAKVFLRDSGLWLWNYQSHLVSKSIDDQASRINQRRQEAIIVANFCDRRIDIAEKITALKAMPGYQLEYLYRTIPDDAAIEEKVLYFYSRDNQVCFAGKNSENFVERFILKESDGLSRKQLGTMLEVLSDDIEYDTLDKASREILFSVTASYGYEALDLNEQIKQRQDIYKSQLKNSELALSIQSNYDRLKLAMDRNRISRESVEKSVAFGERHKTMRIIAKAYRTKSFYDPKKSHEIMTDFGLYYGHIIAATGPGKPLKSLINEIQHQSYHYRYHAESEVLSHTQSDLDSVLRYLDFDYEVTQILTDPDNAMDKMKERLDDLSIERNKLADEIIGNMAEYEAIIDHFGAKSKRLKVHQAMHQARARVKRFSELLAIPKDQEDQKNFSKQWLAHQIKIRKKRHGIYIHEFFDPDVSMVWKSIHLANWRYEHRQSLVLKSKQFKISYRIVRRYLEMVSLSSQAWRSALKKRQRSSPNAEKYIRYAQGCSYRRDQLASQMHLENCAGVFVFEHVNLAKVSVQARTYDYMQRYRHETSHVKKLRMAHYMMAHFRLFGHLVAHCHLDQEVREFARHYHYLKMMKKTPDLSVKRMLRFVEQYEQKRFCAGQAWRTHKQFEKHQKLTTYTLYQAKHLTQQRNLAAFELMNYCANQPFIEPQIEGVVIDSNVLEKHAKQHIAYHRVLDYLNSKNQQIRGQLAHELLSDRSSYHFIYDQSLDFKQLRQESRQWLKERTLSDPLVSELSQKSSIQPHKKHWDMQLISKRLMLQPETTYLAIFGEPKKRSAKEWRYSGGLIVTLRGSNAGQWYSFSEGRGGGPLKAIQLWKHLSFQDALAFGASLTGLSKTQAMTTETFNEPPTLSHQKYPKVDVEREQRVESATSIWAGTQRIQGTLAERYFVDHRGVSDIHHMEMRYWPVGSHWVNYQDGKRLEKTNKIPAVVIPVRDASNQLTGVQRIYLDGKTGGKNTFMDNAKLSKGVTKGSAGIIQVGKQGGRLYIAEGPETCASIALVEPDATVLASLGVNNLTHMAEVVRRFEPSDVILAADNDGYRAKTRQTTEHAFKRLQEKLHDTAINFQLIYPKSILGFKKTDWNDVLVKKGVKALEDELLTVHLGKGLYYHQGSDIAYTRAEHYLREVKGLIGADLSEIRYHENVMLPNQTQGLPAILIPAVDAKGMIKAELVLYLDSTGDNVIQTDVRGQSKNAVVVIQQNPLSHSVYISDNFVDAKSITIGNHRANIYVSLDHYKDLASIDWILTQNEQRPSQIIMTTDNIMQDTQATLYRLGQPLRESGGELWLARGRLKDGSTHVSINEALVRQDKIRGDSFIQHFGLSEPERVTFKEKIKRAMTPISKKPPKIIRPRAHEPLSYYINLDPKQWQVINHYFKHRDQFEQQQDYSSALTVAKQAQVVLKQLSKAYKEIQQHSQSIVTHIEATVFSQIRERLSQESSLGLHDFDRLFNEIATPKLDFDTQTKLTEAMKFAVDNKQDYKKTCELMTQFLKEKGELIELLEFNLHISGSHQIRLTTQDVKQCVQAGIASKDVMRAIHYMKRHQQIWSQGVSRQKEHKLDEDRSY